MSDFEEQPQDESAPAPAAQDPSDDPVEEALYTAFMEAQATGADASQAFNVGTYAAKQVALEAGIPEMAFEQITSDLFGPYTEALNQGHSPQEALRAALQSLET